MNTRMNAYITQFKEYCKRSFSFGGEKFYGEM